MLSLDTFAREKLARLTAAELRREPLDTFRRDGVHVERDGRRLVSFSCNDYLNLSHHPAVLRAATEATLRHGTGAGASRLVTGNHPLYAALETRLAAFKATERALVFGSGYLTNMGVIPALAGPGDLILLDALAHACLDGGARLSGATRASFRHNDIHHLAELLAQRRGNHGRCIIATEHVFSMDGDLAPIADLATLARDHDAWLLVDDAHGMGVIDPPGADQVPLQIGTLSKALASYGGYLAASDPVIALLHSRARPFVYSTGLPPASIAAAIAALDLIAADPVWAASPLERARQFCAALGLPSPQSQIVPIMLGDAAAALAASRHLEAAGFLVTAIRPPTVPAGTARLRLTFTANHTGPQIAALAAAVGPLIPAA